MVKRRSWGSGAVYRRKSDGQWIARLEVHDGRPGRHQVTRSRATRNEAKAALEELRSSLSPATDETVAEYLERWLRDGVSGNVRARTAAGYRTIVDRHLVPTLGGYRLDLLRPADVQHFVGEQLKRYSSRSVSHQLACLRTALAQAEREGIVIRNVAALVKGPHVPHAEIRPLSQAQASAFLAYVKDDRLEALYILAVHTGMRQGELLGLRWEDLDLEHGKLHVRKALVVGGRYLDDVKTPRSRRTIELSASIVAALREHQRRQMGERVGNRKRVEQGLVFAGELGSPLDASRVTQAFQRHLAVAGLPRQRFHDLRHTAASIMHANGIPMRTIADVLGHSTPSVTANIYAHLGDEAGRDVAERMERALG